MPLLDPFLKNLLICPACKGELDEDEAALTLRCRDCSNTYAVRDFPVMMTTEGTKTPARDEPAAAGGDSPTN